MRGMVSSLSYYPRPRNPGSAPTRSDVVDGPAQLPGDHGQPKRDVDLSSFGGFRVELQRVIVVGDLVDRLRLGAEVLGAPDADLVAVLEQAAKHLRRHRRPRQGSHARHQLDVMERQ